MRFSQFKTNRLAELINAQWGDLRIPDLLELIQYANPQRVLEIGSYAGVSTEVFALHCSQVTSVDPSPEMAVRRRLHGNLSGYPHVRLFQALSLPTMRDLIQRGEKFDLIYLDGDHSYEMVKEEIKLAKSLVADGGWIGGHDYCDQHEACPGVQRAVCEEFILPDRTFSDGSWVVNRRTPPC